MRRTMLAFSVMLSAALAVSATAAFAADMFSGTWKLNVAKSKYDPGPAPKSGTQTITTVAGGLKVVTDGVNSEGKKTHNEFTVKFDGKDYPEKPTIDGKPNPDGADTISAKKIDDYTYETTTKKTGKVLSVSRIVISKDGKTRTATTSGKNAQGQTVNNTTVGEKQ